MSEKLLKLLGASSEEEAVGALSRFQAFLGEIQSITGKESGEGILAAVREQKSVAEVAAQVVGKSSAAAIAGGLHSLQAKASEAIKSEAELERMKAKSDAEAVIDARPDLPPATREAAMAFFARHGLDAMREFVAAVPVRPVPSAGPGPEPQPHGSPVARVSDGTRIVATALGMRASDVAEAEKAWNERHAGSESETTLPRNVAVIHLADVVAMNRDVARGTLVPTGVEFIRRAGNR